MILLVIQVGFSLDWPVSISRLGVAIFIIVVLSADERGDARLNLFFTVHLL